MRREGREETVRIVEYTPFPRALAGQLPRIGFTRDLSESGLCLGVDAAEPTGSLLRIVLRDVDGSATRAAIARVTWCGHTRDGRHWLGLEILAEKSPQRETALAL